MSKEGLKEGLRKYLRGKSEDLVGRGIKGLVRLHIPDGFDDYFRQEITRGVPIIYSNHQAHADALALAVVSEYLRELAAKTPGAFPLRGFAMPVAASLPSGNQGKELEFFYKLLNNSFEQEGLFTRSVTREKDRVLYDMSRLELPGEMLWFARMIDKSYGIAIFLEGTVQGGRHPKGTSIEEIYGIQEMQGAYLKGFHDLVERITGWPPLLTPAGVDGGFRLQQSPEEGEPKVTITGKISLAKACIGLPVGTWIDATLGKPFYKEELDSDWEEGGPGLNKSLTKKILPLIPTRAWGNYGRAVASETPGIELLTLS